MPDNVQNILPAYEYEPLDLTRDQIRLITLKPGPEDSPIQCDLHVLNQEDVPEYVALSYTWGPPAPTETILVNGRCLSIRKNLHDFLTCYRNDPSNTRDRCIWIDQICISQAHTAERNHQVRLMARIYTGCLYTVIWLGKESQQAARNFSNRRFRSETSAIDLASNQYFSRLWIVQEVILSHERHILCGTTWIDAEDLGSFLNAILDEVGGGPAMVAYYLLHRSHSQDLELEHALIMFGEQKCEDPRDKIYGLMSLIQGDERIVVDYQKTMEEIFFDIAMVQRRVFMWDHALLDISQRMGLHKHETALRALINDLTPEETIEYGCSRDSSTGTVSTWWYVRRSPRVKISISADGTQLMQEKLFEELEQEQELLSESEKDMSDGCE